MTLIIILFVLYWLPVIVAAVRGHNSTLAIFMLDLFLGWTCLGWIIALIWSCTGDVEKDLNVQIVDPLSPPRPLPPPRDWTDHLDDFCAKHFGWR